MHSILSCINITYLLLELDDFTQTYFYFFRNDATPQAVYKSTCAPLCLLVRKLRVVRPTESETGGSHQRSFAEAQCYIHLTCGTSAQCCVYVRNSIGELPPDLRRHGRRNYNVESVLSNSVDVRCNRVIVSIASIDVGHINWGITHLAWTYVHK